MKLIVAGAVALLMVFQFAGCSRTTTTGGNSSMASSQPAVNGLLAPSQVSPCCRALAEGRIGIDQCMQNPACVANNRTCCMKAIQ